MISLEVGSVSMENILANHSFFIFDPLACPENIINLTEGLSFLGIKSPL
jgi:hypothetical protein